MAKKKNEDTSFKKKLVQEIQSHVRGGLKRVSNNEILLTPQVDVYESANEYAMYFSIPGMGKEDIDVRIMDGELIVEEKKGLAKTTSGDVIIKEMELGRYYRKIKLTEEIDLKNVNGTVDKGILSLCLKKVKASTPSRNEAVEEKKGKSGDERPARPRRRRRSSTKTKSRTGD